MRTRTLLVLAALSLPSSLASADEPVEGDTVRFAKKTVLELSELEVSGTLTRPAHSLVLSRRRTRFTSLIRTRADFHPELERSTDSL